MVERLECFKYGWQGFGVFQVLLDMKYPGARGLPGHSSKDWEYLKYKHVEYQIEKHNIKAAKREVAQLSTPHTPRCPSGVGGF